MDLHELVKKSFLIDDMMSTNLDKERSRENEKALKMMNDTTKKVEENQWETGLLWKHKDITLPASRNMALHRLHHLERKLDKNLDLKATYQNIIDEYIKKDYLKLADNSNVNTARAWYLPHFCVTNPMKPGKVRIVFDAAAKSNGVSLNDVLLQGPDLLKSLPGVLLKFRQGRIGFIGDIKEMFHRIQIREEDVNSQLILWRGKRRTGNPDVYQMRAMTFGAKCSPSSAIYVKDRNAEEHLAKYPAAVKAIKENHYMDDYLGCADDALSAIQLIKDVIYVHRCGGFEIRNWSCSSLEVTEQIPENLQGHRGEVDIQVGDVGRVLGIKWLTSEDSFTFSTHFARIDPVLVRGEKCPTKREVLKLVISVFDPLGFLAPLISNARILLQKIWREKINWDDEISDDLYYLWKKWLNNLHRIASIKIPRCYSPNINIIQTIQLHLFVDASEEAMAAVAYFRIENESKIDVTMVVAKVKVSPLKPTTIPRLELHAAVIGSRLATVIRSQHNISFEKTFFWSDSNTVLHWIGSEHRRFKQFVAHRLGEISESTNITDWNWVPTKENVADDATRLDFKNLETESRCFRGPSFLYQTENLWPTRVIRSASVDVEERHEIVNLVVTTTRPIVPDIFKFSSWLRLIRTTAWLYRYYHNSKRKEKRKNGEISVGEFQDAELLWIKESQHLSFSKEIASLSQGTQVEKSSRLYKLSPAMIDGIIRIKGRLDNLPDSDLWMKYSAILDGQESYTRLLIKHYHEVSNHMGYERVLNELNQRYCILKVRPVLRGVNFACNKCKIRRAKPQPTIMGQLPAARLTSCLPFMYTGVDFFGPITVKTGRKREKRYGMLFTCLTIRAVHVEITPSLETDTCINAM